MLPGSPSLHLSPSSVLYVSRGSPGSFQPYSLCVWSTGGPQPYLVGALVLPRLSEIVGCSGNGAGKEGGLPPKQWPHPGLPRGLEAPDSRLHTGTPFQRGPHRLWDALLEWWGGREWPGALLPGATRTQSSAGGSSPHCRVTRSLVS